MGRRCTLLGWLGFGSVLLLVLSSINCDKNGDGSPTIKDGRFLDAAVEGLSYSSGGQAGLTDAGGSFRYEEHKSVRFQIGGILLGEGEGSAVMTPIDLVPEASDETNDAAANIARFLMTLDDDADPADRITIVDAVRTGAADMYVNFGQSGENFESDPDVVEVVSTLTGLTSAGERTLVETDEAQDHLSDTILEEIAGPYAGTYNHPDNLDRGTWLVVADISGGINGFAVSSVDADTIWLEGQFSTNRSMDMEGTGGGSYDVRFWGNWSYEGAVWGSWELVGVPVDTGTYVGNKEP